MSTLKQLDRLMTSEQRRAVRQILRSISRARAPAVAFIEAERQVEEVVVERARTFVREHPVAAEVALDLPEVAPVVRAAAALEYLRTWLAAGGSAKRSRGRYTGCSCAGGYDDTCIVHGGDGANKRPARKVRKR